MSCFKIKRPITPNPVYLGPSQYQKWIEVTGWAHWRGLPLRINGHDARLWLNARLHAEIPNMPVDVFIDTVHDAIFRDASRLKVVLAHAGRCLRDIKMIMHDRR